MNLNKHVWEGWTAQDFVNDLEPTFDMIMQGKSWIKPFKNKKEVKEWCMSEQPFYKKHVPLICNYFTNKANL